MWIFVRDWIIEWEIKDICKDMLIYRYTWRCTLLDDSGSNDIHEDIILKDDVAFWLSINETL